ncbi:hypothetical protein ACGYLO_11130 [Sulfitobacter sp. 1A13353]|uniref:hypothetical protein n=1 Tax=Sulfitobacter sp. 1A13353 TaxID=3368568 RepID=UPI003745BA33
MQYSDKQMKDGRARLKRLLPEARAYARKAMRNPDIQMQINTAKGMATQRFIRADNFRALVVYRTPRGWYADLLLKQVPPGVSDVMGTPMSMPHETREEAEEAAVHILQSMCLQSIMNEGLVSDGSKADVRPFKLFNISMPLPGEAVDLCVPVMAITGQTVMEARTYALSRLEEACARIGIDETTTIEDMADKPDADHEEIFRLCCMTAATNCIEFPVSEWAAEEVLDDPKDGSAPSAEL